MGLKRALTIPIIYDLTIVTRNKKEGDRSPLCEFDTSFDPKTMSENAESAQYLSYELDDGIQIRLHPDGRPVTPQVEESLDAGKSIESEFPLDVNLEDVTLGELTQEELMLVEEILTYTSPGFFQDDRLHQSDKNLTEIETFRGNTLPATEEIRAQRWFSGTTEVTRDLSLKDPRRRPAPGPRITMELKVLPAYETMDAKENLPGHNSSQLIGKNARRRQGRRRRLGHEKKKCSS